jgi:DNA-binding transcriptional ArsR family regulator
MAIPVRFHGLRFACECVSREDGHTDPWASVAKEKLLNDGTKEEILNLVAQGSKTISQLAEALGLSAASIHKHVTEMTHSELLRPSTKRERKHPAERYYEPNFPIINADDGAQFEALCHDMAAQIADLFEKRCPRLKRASNNTSVTDRGWTFSDVAHYLYAKTQRGARELLEQRGVLPLRKEHQNGAKWIFWAEEPKS